MKTLFITIFFFFASNSQTIVIEKPNCNVALKFINDYTEVLNNILHKKTESTIVDNWIANNTALTTNFKTTYKNLLDFAYKEEPEVGLDFDPILDAQDFPDKGFELVNCDSETGYVIVRGRDMEDFILTLKIIQRNNKWLVDGSGIINIPKNKRARR